MSACIQCGNELPANGDCPVCLLNLGKSHHPDASSGPEMRLAPLPTIEQLNAMFPQLEVTRLIGRGGMGAIFHARQRNLDRDVALKIIASEVAEDPSFSERFEREAKTLARLSHPNIVTVYDFGQTADGQAYLVMEYVDGINLREAIEAKTVGPEDALHIVKVICGALQYAHGKGVVHRDIKPENILLGEDGALKVADFGIAKIVDDTSLSQGLTATRQVLGSLHYLAPEHLESPTDVDHRVDLYALGVVFYELLTGHLPLGRFEPPSAVGGTDNHRIDEIVMKTLSRKPSLRFQSASELSAALERIDGAAEAPVLEPVEEAAEAYTGAMAVPFTCQTMGGLAEIAGMATPTRDGLLLEYRLRDTFWGGLKSNTQQVSIKRGQLARVEAISGFFSSKVVLVATNMSALQNLPNAESGRVELKVKNVDFPDARALVNSLNGHIQSAARVTPKPVPVAPNPIETSPNWMTFAILMILCGIINAGLLAISEVAIAEEFHRADEFALGAVMVAILFGPVAILQLATGFVCLFAKPLHLARAAATVSVLPIAPAFLLSLPVGIWTLIWTRNLLGYDLANSPKQATPKRKSWTATTLMYVRETRQGRILAALNVLGLVLLVAGLSTYRFGMYPSSLSYRIVQDDVESSDLLAGLRGRLGRGQSMSVYGGRVEIYDWQANLDAIQTKLDIEGNASFVWLCPTSELEEGNRTHLAELGIAQDLRLSDEYVSESELGKVALGESKPLPIESDDFSQIQANGYRISFRLTKKGRERLLSAKESEGAGWAVGLIADDMLIGFSEPDDQSARDIEFQVATRSGLADALIAAVRGPALPSELELLD